MKLISIFCRNIYKVYNVYIQISRMNQIARKSGQKNEIVSTTWPQLKQESFDSEQVLQKLCPQGIINIGQCSGASCN